MKRKYTLEAVEINSKPWAERKLLLIELKAKTKYISGLEIYFEQYFYSSLTSPQIHFLFSEKLVQLEAATGARNEDIYIKKG